MCQPVFGIFFRVSIQYVRFFVISLVGSSTVATRFVAKSNVTRVSKLKLGTRALSGGSDLSGKFSPVLTSKSIRLFLQGSITIESSNSLNSSAFSPWRILRYPLWHYQDRYTWYNLKQNLIVGGGYVIWFYGKFDCYGPFSTCLFVAIEFDFIIRFFNFNETVQSTRHLISLV